MKKLLSKLVIIATMSYMFIIGIWEWISYREQDVWDYILNDYDNWGI